MDGVRGKIYSVRVRNFVVYDSVTFFPGEYLNIIIGANGTGKSTIVSAIVLGMGGNANVLGRMSQIKDYVKNGKEEAFVEVTIYNSDEDTKDRRTFSRHFDCNGSDKFSMNGKPCTKTAFLAGVASFNIQVENLCQFLPQDRVQDFAKMNAQELLDSTQISVCSPEVAEMLSQLKVLRSTQLNGAKDLAESQAKLNEHEQRAEVLKTEIGTIRQRDKLVEKVAVCEKKMGWLKFEELFVKFTEQKEDLKKATENHKLRENEMKPFAQRLREISEGKFKLERQSNETRAEYEKHLEKMGELKDTSRRLKENIGQAKADYEFAVKSADEQQIEVQRELVVQEMYVTELRQSMIDAGSEDDRNAKVAQIQDTISRIKDEMNDFMSKRRQLGKHLDETIKPQLVSVTNRIKAIESVGDRKLETLRNRNDNAYRAVMWLRQNAHVLKGRVYEPILLELTVLDSSNAKYLENCIAERDLVAFTCEEKDDMSILHRKLRVEQKLSVNILHSSAATEVAHKARQPISKLARYGFHSFLIDMVEAPVPILNALCRLNHIHQIPVGSDATYNTDDDNIPDYISTYFSTNHRFSVTRSQYSDDKSTSCSEIDARGLLGVGINQAAIQQEKRKYDELLRESDRFKNQFSQVEMRITELEQKTTDLLAERKKVEQLSNVVAVAKEKLERHIAKVNRLKNSIIDLEEANAKMEETLASVAEKSLSTMEARVAAYRAYLKNFNTNECAREKLDIYNRNNAEAENELRERQDQVNVAKKFVDKITAIVDRTKLKCKELQREAKALTDGHTPSDPTSFPYTNSFAKLPATIDELQTVMDEWQSQVDCLRCASETVLTEYNERKQQIALLTERIANFGQHHEQAEHEMERLHQQWYPAISDTVNVINRQYSEFMNSMGFAGEVELMHKEKRDYALYGIEIRVKYRNNEQLQALDRFVQSGGERAVAIAIYSLSLQRITNVPFRCVDEINQGMDPTNERKIFNLLVNQTAQHGQSQYFFVSPKLLPDFEYNDLMKFHCVHNGLYTSTPDMFEKRELQKEQ